MLINENFVLSKNDIESFQKDGFVVLRNFLTDFFLEYAASLSDDLMDLPKTNYGSTFNRLKYDIGNKDKIFLKLIQTKLFKETMLSLTKNELLFTQGLAFELEKNKDKGFPWHVGTVSFGCHHKEDMGYTMWIPFCKIDPNAQRGGMKLLSQNKLSGEFIFDYINLLPERLKFMMKNGEKVDFDYFYNLKNDILNLPSISDLFDYHATEDYFEPKDVVLFNKFVLHRSVPLEEGDINTRKALALRFIDIDSKYDKKRALAQEFPKQHFDYAGSSSFNMDVCNIDGKKLINSHLFYDDIEQRLIKYDLD